MTRGDLLTIIALAEQSLCEYEKLVDDEESMKEWRQRDAALQRVKRAFKA